MNQKLKKALAERERKAQRITEMQARNKELDKMIAEMEYAELHEMLRSAGMSFEEFAQRFPAMLAAQAQSDVTPEQESVPRQDDPDTLTQEENEGENEDENEEAAQAGEEADGAAVDGDDFGGDIGDDAGGDWDLR